MGRQNLLLFIRCHFSDKLILHGKSIHGGTLFLKTDNGNSTWGSEFKLIKTVFKYCVFIFTHVFLQLVQG